MTITAKFPGFCPCCNGRIAAGDKVEWSKGAKATHVACAGRGRGSSAPTATRSPTTTRYSSARRRSCTTGGNCSSFGSGRSCGGHDCDGM